ncbi:hypothetical protein FEM48_ZijujUnG0019100 [Ziziphus jujuba var. spinosa]|uniref:Cytochrome c assembly protein domain-containing protein n=1 Tax=Ziziphus jujuba var. spinosa TaxID=714518 RepID=A0A978U9S6_ZIZJJ|nr:hypothetical protein FEM48_ZijujUnG0019100 [Ziziphus jujuba var. spinosa]
MSFTPLGARCSRVSFDHFVRISSFLSNRLQNQILPQDPISAIHPPCIYAKDVANAMGYGLCRSKMMDGIMELHSPPMRKDAAEKNGKLLRSARCIGSRITNKLFILKFKDTTVLVNTGREQAKRVVRNEKKDTTTSPLYWTTGVLPGSWWAHHELGRGGWWFRDPGENASFMPWSGLLAPVHSFAIEDTRGIFL